MFFFSSNHDHGRQKGLFNPIVDKTFDKEVQFDANGEAIATQDNPYALTFDPSYVYGPNQGIRGFLGLRYSIN